MILVASTVRFLRDGKAFWYADATTSAGAMFVKVPLVDPTGGHESHWQEYIALRLARALGLPVLEPHPIEIARELVANQDLARTFWGHGNRFTATPYQRRLASGSGYDELSDADKALLYVFDNFLFYTDRARPSRPPSRQDCWLGDDGQPIIVDWDYYGAPTRSGPGIKADYYNWDASKFLGVQRRAIEIERSCGDVVVRLADCCVIRDVVAAAAAVWDRVDETAVCAWLIARRNALSGNFSNTASPPWMP